MMIEAVLKLISRERRFVDMYSPTAERNQPKAIRYIAGTFEVSVAMTGIVINMSAAPTETTKPAVSAV
jgi:hypothetical protein